jgi:hypothetical protein
MRASWKRFCATLMGLSAGLLLLPMDSEAMPSFARQTGMNCNSCHIGTDATPNFTRTGRIFAMRGYVRPVVRERLRHEGDAVEDMPHYGGEYLSLNWNDFFAARLVSDLATGGKTINGAKLDTQSRPLARMAFFYTGPITDWLGLWTEIGYLGNNTLNSVTTGQQGPTGLNFYAFDEYRLSTGMDIGPGSFIGASFGNEIPNVVSQWNFPVGQPDMWNNGQGVFGRSKDIAALTVYGLFQDRYWAQVGFVSGADNISWSNGSNIYSAFGYNALRKQQNDLWFLVETYSGKDTTTMMTPVKDSFICPGACPPGVTDSSLSFVNTRGGGAIVNAPVVKVKDFFSYKIRAEHTAADLGPHTWLVSAMYHYEKDNLSGGGNVERAQLGLYARYFFMRTYGIQANWVKEVKYDFTNAAGVKRGTYTRDNFGLVLLWNPAMNFSTHLVYNPRVQNRVFDDERSLYRGDGSNYNLGFEYNF